MSQMLHKAADEIMRVSPKKTVSRGEFLKQTGDLAKKRATGVCLTRYASGRMLACEFIPSGGKPARAAKAAVKIAATAPKKKAATGGKVAKKCAAPGCKAPAKAAKKAAPRGGMAKKAKAAAPAGPTLLGALHNGTT